VVIKSSKKQPAEYDTEQQLQCLEPMATSMVVPTGSGGHHPFFVPRL